MLPSPEDVHCFWFGEVSDWAGCVRRNSARWFERGRELDDEVRERFSELLAVAAEGALENWRDSAQGALALVLTLDQFPRHIHRGTPLAFATDARARSVCLDGVARSLDEALSPVEQSFFYLPLEHAEDARAQLRCVELMRRRAAQSPPDLAAFMGEVVRYAEIHRDIVLRFGRFPHRNAVLGRRDTVEEKAWLDSGGARFGQ